MARMSKLFTFLENLHVDNEIKIYNESEDLVFEGKVGGVPQRISNKSSVILGSVVNNGSFIKLTIKTR